MIESLEEDVTWDDEYACFTEVDAEFEHLSEKIVPKYVVRQGKKVKKWLTDKQNYRIQFVNGKPTEVRMSPQEIVNRNRAQKRAVKKRKAEMTSLQKKRHRSMLRRKDSKNSRTIRAFNPKKKNKKDKRGLNQ